MDYIATFFSHFGSIRFQQQCVARGWQATMRPVPRDLSSSCGTCVYFSTAELPPISELLTPELEQLVQREQNGNGYIELFKVAD